MRNQDQSSVALSPEGSAASRAEDAPSQNASGDCFTVVFTGSLRRFSGNPFHVESPFGEPFVIGHGDAFGERDKLADIAEELLAALKVAEGALDRLHFSRNSHIRSTVRDAIDKAEALL